MEPLRFKDSIKLEHIGALTLRKKIIDERVNETPTWAMPKILWVRVHEVQTKRMRNCCFIFSLKFFLFVRASDRDIHNILPWIEKSTKEHQMGKLITRLDKFFTHIVNALAVEGIWFYIALFFLFLLCHDLLSMRCHGKKIHTIDLIDSVGSKHQRYYDPIVTHRQAIANVWRIYIEHLLSWFEENWQLLLTRKRSHVPHSPII